MDQMIRLRGARQHNLKGIDVSIPRRAVTVITGPSGSGKSSLAFDTIYAEGQRRYIESLSTYAKQFLERMEKPAVDAIDGVSPSVAIDQKNAVKTSRSTVGTVTEVYDYLRLLWARVGRTVCPRCERPVVPDTVQSAADALLGEESGARVYVCYPLLLSAEISHAVAVANLEAQGYLRVIASGVERYLPELEAIPDASFDLTTAKDPLVVVDRIVVAVEERERLVDSLAAAFAGGAGRAVVLSLGTEPGTPPGDSRRHRFTEAFRCADCGRDFPEPRPSLFSFNSPAGACPKCTGFGAVLEYEPELIVPDPSRSLEEGAVDPWAKPRYRRERAMLRAHAARRGFSTTTAWRDLPAEIRRELLEGGPGFQGVLPFLRSKEPKRYKRYIRVFLRQYQMPRRCDLCGGTRLREEALAVRVDGLRIADVTALPIRGTREWLKKLDLGAFEAKVASTILAELSERLEFLDEVGLGYLSLDRQARTLSGGEMQRIRLASCLGSHLVDTLYVLDEPTIGLHPQDIDRFVDVLWKLRDRGNTVLVVEHEPRVLERAEHIIELGPGSGERGGEVVFEGRWEALLRAPTATGRALAARGEGAGDGDRRLRGRPGRQHRGAEGLPRLELRGAALHNVRGLDLELPLGAMVAVTGVSGSGKSTLVHDILYRALEKELSGRSSAKVHLGAPAGAYEELRGVEAIDRVVLVDQSPIGRTPRSNPVTYIGAFGEIRRIFAAQPEARRRGYEAGDFSFNRPGGRCELCKGTGEERIDMVFLADVAVPCAECGGKRYRPELLEVKYRHHDIREILDLTVDRAIRFFIRQDRLGERLWQLQRVGLGYLRLGQPATTLSGGEAQRLKVARELARAGPGRCFYILDEPTVGLGLGEIAKLMGVLRQLVAAGHTVLIVEHNLDVIAGADWIVDLGPGAAEEGGRIVAEGPPSTVAAAPGSQTGACLKAWFRRGQNAASATR